MLNIRQWESEEGLIANVVLKLSHNFPNLINLMFQGNSAYIIEKTQAIEILKMLEAKNWWIRKGSAGLYKLGVLEPQPSTQYENNRHAHRISCWFQSTNRVANMLHSNRETAWIRIHSFWILKLQELWVHVAMSGTPRAVTPVQQKSTGDIVLQGAVTASTRSTKFNHCHGLIN